MSVRVRLIHLAVFVAAVLGLVPGAAAASASSAGSTSSRLLCRTASSGELNVNTDCQSAGNYAETSISVNPTNRNDIVGGVIHTTFSTVNGRPALSQFTEPHASVDGGRTWSDVGLDHGSYRSAVDPSVAFDGSGHVYLATANSGATNDIVVARSEDGGLNWFDPVPITSGIDGPTTFNDHPKVTAFADGKVVVTWIHEVFSDGQLVTAPVYDAVSHDRGKTWSTPADISGSAPFCVGRQGGDACDQTFGNSVAISRGRAVVAFQQTYKEAPDAGASLGRDTYLAVVVDPMTGARLSGPVVVGQERDGIIEHDYPLNDNGVQTLHDSQFAVSSDGNVAADPTDPRGLHFALVWYDDRGAALPVPTDPYEANTNSEIVVSQTFDGGNTWSRPAAIAQARDQFMPWAAYDLTGNLRVGFLDRSYDPTDRKYGFTLATETRPGQLDFRLQRVATALSDPTRNDLPSAGTVKPSFPYPASFVGDYTGLAADGRNVVAYWTDFRNQACQAGRCGSRSNSYFARSSPSR